MRRDFSATKGELNLGLAFDPSERILIKLDHLNSKNSEYALCPFSAGISSITMSSMEILSFVLAAILSGEMSGFSVKLLLLIFVSEYSPVIFSHLLERMYCWKGEICKESSIDLNKPIRKDQPDKHTFELVKQDYLLDSP